MVSALFTSMRHWPANWFKFLTGRSDVLVVPSIAGRAWYYRDKSWHALRLRPKTTDIFGFCEVFAQEEYRTKNISRHDDLAANYEAILAAGRKPLILDGGANIGLSTLYLAEAWPQAKVVAIEPDAGNVEMIERNCAGRDVDIIHAGLSARPTRLAIANPSADPNAFRTEASDKGSIEGLTVSDLLTRYPASQYQPFILKLDIEGAERDLFADDPDWIDAFALIMIELHDYMYPSKANSTTFLSAIAHRNRDFLCRDNTVFSVRN